MPANPSRAELLAHIFTLEMENQILKIQLLTITRDLANIVAIGNGHLVEGMRNGQQNRKVPSRGAN